MCDLRQLKECLDTVGLTDYPTVVPELLLAESEITNDNPPNGEKIERRSGYIPSHSPYSTTVKMRELPPSNSISQNSNSSSIFNTVYKKLSFASNKAPIVTVAHELRLAKGQEVLPDSLKPLNLDLVPASVASAAASAELPEKDKREQIFRLYCSPIKSNFTASLEAMTNLMESIPVPFSEDVRTNPPSCLLAENETAILKDLFSATSEGEMAALLREQIDRANAQLALRWNMFMSFCKRWIPHVCKHLRQKYVRDIRLTWRRQMLVQTKKYVTFFCRLFIQLIHNYYLQSIMPSVLQRLLNL